jgi:hypothetical protein
MKRQSLRFFYVSMVYLFTDVYAVFDQNSVTIISLAIGIKLLFTMRITYLGKDRNLKRYHWF